MFTGVLEARFSCWWPASFGVQCNCQLILYCLQPGAVIKVEGTRDGRLAFSGGQDGCILAHDLR